MARPTLVIAGATPAAACAAARTLAIDPAAVRHTYAVAMDATGHVVARGEVSREAAAVTLVTGAAMVAAIVAWNPIVLAAALAGAAALLAVSDGPKRAYVTFRRCSQPSRCSSSTPS